MIQRILEETKTLLKNKSGPLTRELILEPGRFGLGKVPKRLAPKQTTTMVCGYCSTGCGLKIHLQNGEATNLSADTEYPVNLGMACPKGWEALTPLRSPDRATEPLLKNAAGEFEPVSWDQALNKWVKELRRIKTEHGPGAAAFLSTGQISTEELMFLGSLWKFGLGFTNGDGNTRQCMATAHVAYKQSFGFDAPPLSYSDFEKSDLLIFVGANPCIAHPIMWERVCRNPNQPKIVVIDPRKTETANACHQHVALRPKSDLTFLYGLANQLIKQECLDSEFIAESTDHFEEFRQFVTAFPLERVEQECGIGGEELVSLARSIQESKACSMWWTMGVNQSHQGVRTAQAIINLCLMTGNIGRPGTGPNSITGQMNAMGSRLFSNQTSLPGGRHFADPTHREEISSLLQVPLDAIPEEAGLAYDQILDEVERGSIKALWIIGTNPVHSWIESGKWDKVRKKLDFLVVQDMYATTASAEKADLILPAAGWGEKEGSAINSERRIGPMRKVAKAPGQALSDFHIFRLVAEYWGCGEMFRQWSSPEAVFQLLKKVSYGRPCDISGIRDYRHLEAAGGIQWPYSEKLAETFDASQAQERRLFEDGKFYTSNQKALFLFEENRPEIEIPDEEYPFVLLTGRGTSAQWHTQTRTGKSAVLQKLYSKDCPLEINASDAEKWGISEGEWIEVITRRGRLKAKTIYASTVQTGHLFIPMHYDGVNALTLSQFDPYSRQPAYKGCAATLKPIAR